MELGRASIDQVVEIYRNMLGGKEARAKKIIMPDGRVIEGKELEKLMEAHDGSKRK